jgi:SAM-dependent methyltransferase
MRDFITRTVSSDDLARLKADRHAADARYNAALTALDAAVQQAPDLPHPPPGPDEHQVTPLNQSWDILATRPAAPPGWRGRLARLVWPVVEPLFAAQQRFNSQLVDHVNRAVPRDRAVPEAIAATIALVRRQAEESIRFQSQLIVFLQAVTPYVDTKDYEFAGLARRAAEDVANAAARLDEVSRGLAAGLSGLSDEVLKRYEALTIIAQRQADTVEELRIAVAAAQQSTTALQRHLERSGAELPARPAAAVATAAAPPPAHAGGDHQQLLAGDPLRSHLYAGFEDLYRGPETEIRERMADYVGRFAGARDVLDVGCGRGEFLELLRDAGVPARGIDLNLAMVERCRAKGLDVVAADALGHLASLPEGSLGGLIAAQVVEHLQPDDLLRFLELAASRLQPGAWIVLETINPACWSAFFDSYVRDLTHARPVHPDTLRYLLIALGFVDAQIEWRSPYPEEGKLARAAQAPATDDGSAAVATALNQHADRLNSMLFGPRDYAAIGRRPLAPGRRD